MMMKKNLSLFFVLIFMCCSISSRNYISLNKWKFHFGELIGAVEKDFDDSLWDNVYVPHDWAIDKPFNMCIDVQNVNVIEEGITKYQSRTGRTGALPAFGVGYYRTEIVSDENMRGKTVYVEFDGAMSLAQVYLNGEYIGKWPYGYTSFFFDLTDRWNFDGNNVLVVRLDNKLESSRWYSGAGLYRNVRLLFKDSVSIAHCGTYVTSDEIYSNKIKVNIQTKIENKISTTVKLKSILYNKEGAKINEITNIDNVDSLNNIFNQNIIVDNPVLWSIDNPYMYKIVSEVYVNDVLHDTYETPIGLRNLKFEKDKGFFLNGKNIKLKGVCLHHDLGPLGAAINTRAIERQLQTMKEMGCNAIRTTHNPPATELLDLCDKMGLLVIVEAFDEWKIGKNANGYHLYFDEWAEKDLVSMIHRDRNHPSIIMWSIGNEVREQRSSDGAKIVRKLTDICHREDASRFVTCGFNMHNDAISNGLTDEVDIVGFNYKPYDYERIHIEHPEYIIYGSETVSTVSSRGEYKFPVEEKKDVYYDDYHVSSYDLEYPIWGSTPDTEFEKQDDCDFILGEFVWTGFDYLGEPTPFNEGTPAKSSYFGIVDLAGLKKDRYYLYQSKWSDKPVLHVLPHWNWEDRIGQNIPIYCYTNYPKAELFVNGISMGIREKSTKDKYERYRLMWKDIIYEPGEIKVVAYNCDGTVGDTKTIKTAGLPYKIQATVDRKVIKADGKDLAFVTVEILDKDGNLCPRANNFLYFDVKGNALFKAACNGDPTDLTSFASSYMRVFNGKLVVIIQSSKSAGPANLKIFGGKLKPAIVNIEIK